MIMNIIHNRFFVLKVSFRFDLTRYVLMAIMLTIRISGFTQSFFIDIETNLQSYTSSPYQNQEVIAKKKVKTMHYCLVEAAEFNAYLEDSLKKPVPTEENEAFKNQYNLKGQLIVHTSNLLSETIYKYTYSEKNDLLTTEQYRFGNKTWQSKSTYKYDAQHHLLQDKSTWNDGSTGALDQVSYFDLVWENDNHFVEVAHKITIERGVKTAGKVTSKSTYFLDEYGLDTLYVTLNYNDQSKDWLEVKESTSFLRDSLGRIIQSVEKTQNSNTTMVLTKTKEWNYDATGKLISYLEKTAAPYNNKTEKLTYYYSKNGLLIGYHEEGSFINGNFAVVYDYY